jgi:hypothetical protein
MNAHEFARLDIHILQVYLNVELDVFAHVDPNGFEYLDIHNFTRIFTRVT